MASCGYVTVGPTISIAGATVRRGCGHGQRLPTMRFGHRVKRLDQRECNAIIRVTAELCTTANLAWRLEHHDGDPGFVALSERMQEARRAGVPFALSDSARHWFDLRYANGDASYALALVLLWAFGNQQSAEPGGPHDHVTIALWHLRMLLPPSVHGVLPVIATAYARHHASLPAQVHQTPSPIA